MPSSTETQVGQRGDIADLFSKASEIADREARELRRISGAILPILAWLDAPVVLSPGALGGSFVRFTSVTLESGGVVVARDPAGSVSSRKLSELRTTECLTLLKGAFPELRRMAENKRRQGGGPRDSSGLARLRKNQPAGLRISS